MEIPILCSYYSISQRIKKSRNSLIELYLNNNTKVFAWNRNNKDICVDYIFTFNQDIGYGKSYISYEI